MNGELDAAPYERCSVCLYLRVGIHDGGVLLNRLENPTKPAGTTSLPTPRIFLVQLGSIRQDSVLIGSARQQAPMAALFDWQAVFKVLQRNLQRSASTVRCRATVEQLAPFIIP